MIKMMFRTIFGGLQTSLFVEPTRNMLVKSSTRAYYKEKFSYEDIYRGGFDYHDRIKYPRRMSPYKEEELLDEVHSIRSKIIENPSPFHIIRRIKSMSGQPWHYKVTLRRLDLHSSKNGECKLVPNTPKYNEMIMIVKHLLELKPARFADGRIPNEEDLGAIKVCPYTGVVRIDEKLRLQERRLNIEKPPLWQGNHLRFKLHKLCGINNGHYMR